MCKEVINDLNQTRNELLALEPEYAQVKEHKQEQKQSKGRGR